MERLIDDTKPVYGGTLGVPHLMILRKRLFENRQKGDVDVWRAFYKYVAAWFLPNKSVVKDKTDQRFKAPEFSWLDCLLIVAVSILFGLVFNFINPTGITLMPEFWLDDTVSHVAPQVAAEKYWEDSLFVDARPNTYYKQGHIKRAVNLPLDLFDTLYMIELDKVDKNKTIIVYGRTKSRHYDEHVSRKLFLRGHTNTLILKGSLAAWKKKGYPVNS